MVNLELGHRTLHWLYNIFNDEFLKGEIVFTGSFYYKRIGCKTRAEYKDVDIVIDNNREDVFHKVMDYAENKYNLIASFRNSFNDEPMVGMFHSEEHLPVDVIRNDFTDLRPMIEIIPSVWSYCLSDKVLYETYKMLEEKLKEPRYTEIKEFFYGRTLPSV